MLQPSGLAMLTVSPSFNCRFSSVLNNIPYLAVDHTDVGQGFSVDTDLIEGKKCCGAFKPDCIKHLAVSTNV